MKEFDKEVAENLTRSLVDVGFTIDEVFYDTRYFGNFGVALTLQDDKPITISMVRDRIYFEARITKEQFLIRPDGRKDYYHFFPENVFIEDLLNALDIKVPKIQTTDDNMPISNNDDNILLLMKLYSEVIAKNIDLIRKAINSSNMIETNKKIISAANRRMIMWSEKLIKKGHI